MTLEQKQLIQMQIEFLKHTMKKERLVFEITVNKEDANKSTLAFVDRDSLNRGERTGIMIGLDDLNRGLV